MPSSFDSVPQDDPLIHSVFHRLLVAFSAPAGWPAWLLYVTIVALAAVSAFLWATMGTTFSNAIMVFLIQVSFFTADRDLLVSLPRRNISFAPWQSQYFALILPRTLVAIALGLLIPWIGWRTSFYVNIAIQVIGTVALYRAAVIEPGRFTLSRVSVPIQTLSPGTPPIRILHISDLHIERLSNRESKILDLVREESPDLILITGDYVNISFNVDPVTHEQVRKLLSQLAAPGGVFAVLGSPAVDLPGVIPPLFEGLPVRLLRNEAAEVILPGGQSLTLIGLDCRHDIAADAAALDRVLGPIEGSKPLILLYHSPDLLPQAVAREIDLYLCGHTHGGQVRLPLIGPLLTSSKLGRRYVMGHYHERHTNLYVSRGVGFEGLGAPRVRLFCPPEVALITLAAAESR